MFFGNSGRDYVKNESEPETRKRRKIVVRDTVEYEGGRITVLSVRERE